MPKSDYTPTTADVGALLRARTRDSGGNLIGDFTDATTPNAAGATAMINEALDEVAGEVGEDLFDPGDQAAAKRLVQLLAAANVEMSYFPEQSAQNNSMYDKLMTRYNTKLATFKEGVAETQQEPQEVNVPGNVAGFPPPQGFGTRPM